MKTKFCLHRVFPTAALMLSASFLVGCSSLRTVQLKADPSISRASVQVDVVGVSAKNNEIESYPIHQYWQSGNSIRNASSPQTARFGMGQSSVQTIAGNWGASGAREVVVLADLPGFFRESGASDPRRLILPVNKSSNVVVLVTAGGLQIVK